MAVEEKIYLGYNNPIQRILTIDPGTGPEAQPTSNFTKMEAVFGQGGTIITSNNGDTDPIRWNKGGYLTGEVRLFMGDQSITANIYTVYIVCYDAGNTDGLVWDSFSCGVFDIGHS